MMRVGILLVVVCCLVSQTCLAQIEADFDLAKLNLTFIPSNYQGPRTNENSSNSTIDRIKVLRNQLFSYYSSQDRPVRDYSLVTNLSILFDAYRIVELREKTQVVTIGAILELKWEDEFLKWNPSEYGNATKISLLNTDIWVPDLVSNSIDNKDGRQRSVFPLEVRSSGTVVWRTKENFQISCLLNIEYFPFDRQNCVLELQSWVHNKNELCFSFQANELNNDFMTLNSEWKIKKVSSEMVENRDINILKITFNLKRNLTQYVYQILLFLVLVFLLTLLFFIAQPDSILKILLAFINFGIIWLMLETIQYHTPGGSMSFSLIGLALQFSTVLIFISMIASLYLINFDMESYKHPKVPQFVSTALKKLSFMLPAPSQATKFSENGDEFAASSMELKNILKSALSTEYEVDLKLELINSVHLNRNKQKSTVVEIFDDYKMTILKCILECERGLLGLKFNKLKLKTLNKSEVFDDWKSLFQLQDRVFLVIYLIIVLVLSIEFYFH